MSFRRFISFWIVVSFFLTTLGPLPKAHGSTEPTTGADTVLDLPVPGTMVNLSPVYEPTLIKGLTVHKDNPFLFDFIVDTGHSGLEGDALKMEGDRLVKYFFACLTIPEKDLWVNLSPYEKGRMVPQALGQTALGRDLLAEDYILKQLTASLIYPEKDLGKSFWERVYAKARQMYGTTQIPVNTFNKVWIVADQASVYEHGQTVFVVSGHLKVMLEEDYLALQKHSVVSPSLVKEGVRGSSESIHTLGSQIVREIVLPEIEKEVNQGKNFSTLRQIFNSLILAIWYKKNLKEALLTQVYADKSTVNGVIASGAKQSREQIYEQYLKAYKKGVFNYIKEDAQPDGQSVPRKYFSGGVVVSRNFKITNASPAMAVMALKPAGSDVAMNVVLDIKSANFAMVSEYAAKVSSPNNVETSEKRNSTDPVESAFSEAELKLNQLMFPDSSLIDGFNERQTKSFRERVQDLLVTVVRTGDAQELAAYIGQKGINFQDSGVRERIRDLLSILRKDIFTAVLRRPITAFLIELDALKQATDLLDRAANTNDRNEREEVVVLAREQLGKINNDNAYSLEELLKSHESLTGRWTTIEGFLTDIGENIHRVHRQALRRYRAQLQAGNKNAAMITSGAAADKIDERVVKSMLDAYPWLPKPGELGKLQLELSRLTSSIVSIQKISVSELRNRTTDPNMIMYQIESKGQEPREFTYHPIIKEEIDRYSPPEALLVTLTGLEGERQYISFSRNTLLPAVIRLESNAAMTAEELEDRKRNIERIEDRKGNFRDFSLKENEITVIVKDPGVTEKLDAIFESQEIKINVRDLENGETEMTIFTNGDDKIANSVIFFLAENASNEMSLIREEGGVSEETNIAVIKGGQSYDGDRFKITASKITLIVKLSGVAKQLEKIFKDQEIKTNVNYLGNDGIEMTIYTFGNEKIEKKVISYLAQHANAAMLTTEEMKRLIETNPNQMGIIKHGGNYQNVKINEEGITVATISSDISSKLIRLFMKAGIKVPYLERQDGTIRVIISRRLKEAEVLEVINILANPNAAMTVGIGSKVRIDASGEEGEIIDISRGLTRSEPDLYVIKIPGRKNYVVLKRYEFWGLPLSGTPSSDAAMTTVKTGFFHSDDALSEALIKFKNTVMRGTLDNISPEQMGQELLVYIHERLNSPQRGAIKSFISQVLNIYGNSKLQGARKKFVYRVIYFLNPGIGKDVFGAKISDNDPKVMDTLNSIKVKMKFDRVDNLVIPFLIRAHSDISHHPTLKVLAELQNELSQLTHSFPSVEIGTWEALKQIKNPDLTLQMEFSGDGFRFNSPGLKAIQSTDDQKVALVISIKVKNIEEGGRTYYWATGSVIRDPVVIKDSDKAMAGRTTTMPSNHAALANDKNRAHMAKISHRIYIVENFIYDPEVMRKVRSFSFTDQTKGGSKIVYNFELLFSKANKYYYLHLELDGRKGNNTIPEYLTLGLGNDTERVGTIFSAVRNQRKQVAGAFRDVWSIPGHYSILDNTFLSQIEQIADNLKQNPSEGKNTIEKRRVRRDIAKKLDVSPIKLERMGTIDQLVRHIIGKTNAKKRVDRAMNGGIDLNTSHGMRWKVSKDGSGVEMNIDPAMIERIRREGIDSLSPVIFKITPISNIWPLAGLQAPEKEPAIAGLI